jgi:hypothetical protein
MTGLRFRYPALNDIHYEAGWTDSWCHRRCMHAHKSLIEAAKCGMPRALAGTSSPSSAASHENYWQRKTA